MFDREEKAAFGLVIAVWIIAVLLGLAFWGTIIWLIFYFASKLIG